MQKAKIKRKTLIWLPATILLTTVSLIDAQQQTKKIPRIGFLHSGSPAVVAKYRDACLQALSGLGYLEGKNISYEYRYAEGKLDRLPKLAGELAHLKVDVIVTGPGNEAPHAAKIATTTIPIVMVIVVDPVGSGLVASLSQPGGNLTGLTFDVTPEQAGKNLELLKEAAPGVSPVAILRDLNTPIHVAYSKEAERVGKFLEVPVQFADVQASSNEQLENAFAFVIRKRAKALLVFAGSSFFADHRPQIVNFAARNKLPAIYPGSPYVDEGGLMSYGASLPNLWPRAATYVDKILKGAKPADLPVEQPKKFELVINLKTAKQIGLTIPQSVLYRADRVIR
jgi:putative tryptophan/tyrosine transport system substrate-binding protein